MKKCENFSRKLLAINAWLGGWAGMLVLWIMNIAIFAGIVTRRLPGVRPITGANEIGGYATLAVIFFGLVWCTREKGHVTLDMVTRKLPPKAAAWLDLFVQIGVMVFIVILLYYSIRTSVTYVQTGVHDPSVFHPYLIIPFAPIPLGLVMWLLGYFSVIVDAVNRIRQGGQTTLPANEIE